MASKILRFLMIRHLLYESQSDFSGQNIKKGLRCVCGRISDPVAAFYIC